MHHFLGRLLKDPDAQYPLPLVVPTGIDALDEALDGGVRCGHMTLIGGITGVGTSTLALTVARIAATSRHLRSLYLAPDTSDTELFYRIVAAEALVDVRRLRRGVGYLSERDMERIASRREKIEALAIWVLGDAGWRESLTQQLAPVTWATDPEDMWGARLVIIDGTATFEPDVREAMCELRRFAQERDLAIIVTTKATVPPARNAKPPELEDLVEYSSVVDLFDTVLMLHRDDMHTARSTRAGEVDIDVAKHRFGSTRSVMALHQGHYARFVNFIEPVR